MARSDIVGIDNTIGSEFNKGLNRYIATTSFRRDGITYFIEINDMFGTNVIATWWDNSDNGFGYNNYGDVYVDNPFNRMTGYFSPENIDDYIGVNSAYDRNLPESLKKAIINRVKRYIDYDALNDIRKTESTKRGKNQSLKLRISEKVSKRISLKEDEEDTILGTSGTIYNRREEVVGRYQYNFTDDCYTLFLDNAGIVERYLSEEEVLDFLDKYGYYFSTNG